MFLIINRIKSGLRFSIIKYQIFFEVKISKNHTSRIFLKRGGTLVLSCLGGCAVLVRHFVLHRYFNYYRSHKYRRLIIDIGTLMIYLVNLGTHRRSKGY